MKRLVVVGGSAFTAAAMVAAGPLRDGVTMSGLACTYGDGGAPLPVGTLGACPGSVTDAGGILFGDGSGE